MQPRFVHNGVLHEEHHSSNDEIVRDIIIGFADGLTVPFALTAGLSSLGSNKLVIIGGLAELFSGAISMGLGGYLASVTEGDHYDAEEKREYEEVETLPGAEKEEIYKIMRVYGLEDEVIKPMVDAFELNKEMWVKFMMRFELELKKPDPSRAWISAGSLSVSYFLGGLIPMIPYFAMHDITHALFVSIGITVVMLLVFGFVKNMYTVGTKKSGAWGAIQTLIVGVLAAATSYGIVRALDSRNPVMTQGKLTASDMN
ncbi:DUF125-domain-containing protein [Mollisia scopiformis]|uniref:DUF125-domain-containing protein n=1 Tax=Mollisia scopiformis TaxID=149040 RepID=A0A194X0Y8_MOLSC|nr:DUF125-domain-containing protein [Mollisia scopiformis]KUJ13527.1 DUF125-domain-containing protein [Mollisia scopiformis]